MIINGIAATPRLHNDGDRMIGQSALTLQEQGEAGFAICDAAALATRTQATLAVLWSRLGAFAEDPRETRPLSVRELGELAALGEDVADLTSQIALILDGLPLVPLAVGGGEIADAARAALADGIVDCRRACTAASLLSADQGFPALAEALIDCDAHAYWDARVVDVIATFRDVDETRARQVAVLVGVPEAARFCDLRPDCVIELAHALRRLG